MDEWIKATPSQLNYQRSQWTKPKQSTVAFEKFISSALQSSDSVIDLGAGASAATAYLAERHPKVLFTAADYVGEFLQFGEAMSKQSRIKNIRFAEIDWYNLETTRSYNGVISMQTLSWLPDAHRPLKEIFTKLQPQWCALTSLFYEGDISCCIQVYEHAPNNQSYYNIYSLPEIARICSHHGYLLRTVEKFDIGFDIAQPASADYMGTYTRRWANGDGSLGDRVQLSGPLMLPWYMLMIVKAH